MLEIYSIFQDFEPSQWFLSHKKELLVQRIVANPKVVLLDREVVPGEEDEPEGFKTYDLHFVGASGKWSLLFSYHGEDSYVEEKDDQHVTYIDLFGDCPIKAMVFCGGGRILASMNHKASKEGLLLPLPIALPLA